MQLENCHWILCVLSVFCGVQEQIGVDNVSEKSHWAARLWTGLHANDADGFQE